MQRLGYTRYVSQGGDCGSVISHAHGACRRHRACSAFMSTCRRPCRQMSRRLTAQSAIRRRRNLRRREKAAFTGAEHLLRKSFGYARDDGHAPADGRLYACRIRPWAWRRGSTTSSRSGPTAAASPSGRSTRDEMLDDITLYWLTNTRHVRRAVLLGRSAMAAATSTPSTSRRARRRDRFSRRDLSRAAELGRAKLITTLIYFNEVDKGGHFAAWEQPQLFSVEIRAAFRTLRQSM